MNRFANLPIRKKLCISVGLITVALGVSSLGSLYQLARVHAQVQQVTEAYVPGMSDLQQARHDLQQALVDERSLLAIDAVQPLARQLREEHDVLVQQAGVHMQHFKQLLHDPGIQALVNEFEAAYSAWSKASAAVLTARQVNGTATADSLGHGNAEFAAMDAALARLVAEVRRQADGIRATDRATYLPVWSLVAAVDAVGILMCLLALVYLPQSILGPLQQLRVLLRQPRGAVDFASHAAVGEEETALLAADIKRLVAGLQEDMGGAAEQVRAMLQSAHQLALAAGKTSRQASQQYEAAMAAAAGVSESAAQVQQMVAYSGLAQDVSAHACALSSNGEQIVNDASTEIARIFEVVSTSSEMISALGQRSDEISSIVKVIRDIADQTNLLALNAAIEAARAGEQGRGFAVVADEVRKLAERTSSATTEITSMISEIQAHTQAAVNNMDAGRAKVQQGVALVRQAADAMTEMNAGTRESLTQVEQISQAAQQQGSTCSAIEQHISQVAHMSQETVQAVQAMSRAATELEMQVMQMKTRVDGSRTA